MKRWTDLIRRWKTQLIMGLLAVAVILYLMQNKELNIKASILTVLMYIEAHKAEGSILFIFFFGFLSCILVPVTFITVAAGIIFKPVILAILLVLLGSQVGLVTSNLLGRTLLRPWVEQRLSQDASLSAIDKAVAREGWKIVILLRLSPIAPFGIANYMLSATSIAMPNLMLATFIGNLPGAITYSIIGSFIGNLSGADSIPLSPRAKYLAGIYSFAFLVGSVVFITMVSKRALRQALRDPATVTAGTDSGVRIGLGSSTNSIHSVEESRPLVVDWQESPVDGGDVGDGRRRVARREDIDSDMGVNGVVRSPNSGGGAIVIDDDADLESGMTGETSSSSSGDDDYTEGEKKFMRRTWIGLLAFLAVGTPLILILT
ncbi:hypothetical protein HDU76_012598 [Blyttiomyces sp. JEL0837]|nr:hypothetical protein HDU76_012598 [Blyttiomyces sp. JEL0837]